MFRRMFKSREIAILNSGSSLVIASPASGVINYTLDFQFCFVENMETPKTL